MINYSTWYLRNINFDKWTFRIKELLIRFVLKTFVEAFLKMNLSDLYSRFFQFDKIHTR